MVDPEDQEKDAVSINSRIGRHVRAIRKERKMTQAALAEAAGISIPYYRQLERGERRWNFDLALKVANVLELSVSGVLPADYTTRPPQPVGVQKRLRPAILQLLGAIEAEQWTDAFISLSDIARTALEDEI